MMMDIDDQSDNFGSNGMCRLCLSSCNDENSVEIFFTNDLSLNVRIMACTGLEVTKQDQLPKRICLECRVMLEKSFLFRNKCKNSDSKLRRHFRLINAGKESHVFDESDDEYEDEYTESIKLISDLNKKIEQKWKLKQALREHSSQVAPVASVSSAAPAPTPVPTPVTVPAPTIAPVAAQVTLEKSNTFDGEIPIQYKLENLNKIPEATQTAAPTIVARTRASNRLRNLPAESKISEVIYDPNGQTIEVLVEDLGGGDEGETEFIISEDIENVFEDPFQSNDSNDEEFEALMANSESQFENEQFSLQDIAKSDDLYVSEESTDDNKNMDDDYEDSDLQSSENASILESILPTIKQSIEARNGTVLDDQTQYKIVRANGDEIKVQCITADGTEYEVEMKQSLPNDFERDETGDLKIFSCSKCPKTFSRRGKLINHERDHSAKTTGQECPYCQKWFPSNSTLTRHIRVHTGEKPFKCSICNRSFIQKEILKRHLMTHSGERPYKCNHCSKSFILKEALRQHINRNHTENPQPEMHNCPFCPKSFCHSSGLSRHLLIHAGRTFACEYCNKKFNDKSALKRHTISIHNANPQIKKEPMSK